MSEDLYETFKLKKPVEMTGNIPEDRKVFYDLAKERIEYQSRQENIDWQQKHFGRNGEYSATFILGTRSHFGEDQSPKKYVGALSVVVNKELIEYVGTKVGQSMEDITPYIVEHELFEGWLNAKKGVGPTLEKDKKHLLARRREFLLATLDGKEEKLKQFLTTIEPNLQSEIDNAMSYAKDRISKPKKQAST